MKESDREIDRILSREEIYKEKNMFSKNLTSSIASGRPSGRGAAFMKSLLCLLGDLERHIILDSSDTVSLKLCSNEDKASEHSVMKKHNFPFQLFKY